ncbi:hypothetical protein GCK72_010560 [Caenorhabditis remanei]|uniref:Uncharacterized protein n=1 Tax=Caenorhabditis remanei TaxID=31234 RepID=A0A6A5H3M3_CAERE|nr:hypothetical protein GCK72_010560 [Caenorhabditis remanei]KAF1762298.1 hypothetical protein GCK72_010560 [Caenorhabditis remanei]
MGKKKKPRVREEILKLFEVFEDVEFPPIPNMLPPQKSLKERLLEQEQERIEEIKAYEKRFSGKSHIPDDVFMALDRTFGGYETVNVEHSNIFKEEMDSFIKTSEPEPDQFMTERPRNAFESLHDRRPLVYWREQVIKGFKNSSMILERFMDERDLARAPNATKRIAKAECINLQIRRYTAEEVKDRLRRQAKDPFGLFSLIPHTIKKSNKSQHERKQILLDSYKDYLQDFNYSERPGCIAISSYLDIQKRRNELKEFLNSCESRKTPVRSVSVPPKRVKENGHEKRIEKEKDRNKRKILESSDDEVIVIPKKVGKEQRLSRESGRLSTDNTQPSAENGRPKKDMMKPLPESEIFIPKKISKDRSSVELVREKKDNVDPSLERKRKEVDKRRELTQKHDQQYCETLKKSQEEHEKKMKEEEEKRKQETIRMREEYVRRQLDLNKRMEEEKRLRVFEEQERKRVEEEKKERIRRKEEAAELERIKRSITQLKEQSLRQEEESAKKVASEEDYQFIVLPAPKFFDGWKYFKCKKPDDWTQRKEKFYNHFNWPLDEMQRDLERSEAKKSASGEPIRIPHENTSTTKIKPLYMPAKKNPNLSVAIKKRPTSPKPSTIQAKPVEEIIGEIKLLMAPSRRNIAHSISLRSQEVDYQGIYLNRLKNGYIYPFHLADGQYWPLFFTLEDTSAVGHVESLVACSSFSGKYASRYLLTSSLEDDDRSKKFDQAYSESDGDWFEYSQKPGRFSNRIGFKGHYSKSKESFEQQKQRARDQLHDAFANETREQDEFCRYMEGYRRGSDRNRKEFKQHLSTHLRQLVRDARLDVYSIKEMFHDIEDGVTDHPGTRDSPLELWWHTHGYRIYLHTRDHEYGMYMYDACAAYEKLLPPQLNSGNVDKFNEWCFTPMLASLHYQSKYKPFDVFSSEKVKRLSERHSKYTALINGRKFSLSQAVELCRLTTLDKYQWTILHDQLVSHFRDFHISVSIGERDGIVVDLELLEDVTREFDSVDVDTSSLNG